MSSSRASHTRRLEKPPRSVRAPRRRPPPPKEWELVDLLPSPLPVTQAEIEVLDKMLGARIDAILKG